MAKDPLRIKRIQHALSDAKLDAILCALPSNVLLLSGYWPVVGTALALVTQDGELAIVAPEDERELAEQCQPDSLITFRGGSLEELATTTDNVLDPLRHLAGELRLHHLRIGYEADETYQPASYVSMHLYGPAIERLLRTAIPDATFASADTLLTNLKSVKTPQEINQIRAACRIAARAFELGSVHLDVGQREVEAAAAFRSPLSTQEFSAASLDRADGYTFCMSGPNAARAYGAYAQSRHRHLKPDETVLLHCNSHVGGYWTDITRTYCLGQPAPQIIRMYNAIAAARAAALSAIRPGVRASAVDAAARNVLTQYGFGNDFKHSTGHGVGFAAIDHNARPRLHPKSEDVLESGMVFNIEPAIYIDDFGGMRHCDVVAVTDTQAELLTDFQNEQTKLVIPVQ